MKIKTIAFMFMGPFSLFAQTARIKIDISRTIGEIDPKIYVYLWSLFNLTEE
jgi:hypothetical protein